MSKPLTFEDGVNSALEQLFDGGCSTIYCEIVDAHGAAGLIQAAKRSGNYESSGLKKWARLDRSRRRWATPGETR